MTDKDPVKHCTLYKEQGCSHVDGILCDFKTCSMRIDYENKYTALVKLVTGTTDHVTLSVMLTLNTASIT